MSQIRRANLCQLATIKMFIVKYKSKWKIEFLIKSKKKFTSPFSISQFYVQCILLICSTNQLTGLNKKQKKNRKYEIIWVLSPENKLGFSTSFSFIWFNKRKNSELMSYHRNPTLFTYTLQSLQGLYSFHFLMFCLKATTDLRLFLSYQAHNPIFLGLTTKYLQFYGKLHQEEVYWNASCVSNYRDSYFFLENIIQ